MKSDYEIQKEKEINNLAHLSLLFIFMFVVTAISGIAQLIWNNNFTMFVVSSMSLVFVVYSVIMVFSYVKAAERLKKIKEDEK